MIVSKNFNHRIDVKSPWLKWIMTPVSPWHDSIHRVLFPISIFWERNEFKEIVDIFKMTKDAILFLNAEIKLKLKLHVIELDK